MSKLSQCTHRGIEEENIVSLSYLDHLISMDFFFDLVFGFGGFVVVIILFCFTF